MSTTTGTTSAGKKPYDPNMLANQFSTNAPAQQANNQVANPYSTNASMTPPAMAAVSPPVTPSAAGYSGDAGSDRTGLMQMNQQAKPGVASQAAPPTASQPSPVDYGNDPIDPYSGLRQSQLPPGGLANMFTDEREAFLKNLRDQANSAANPARATMSANGDLNAIQGQNPNVFNPYTTAADPNAGQGSRTQSVGTNTFQGVNAQTNVSAQQLQNPDVQAAIQASAQARQNATPSGSITSGQPAGSTPGNPFNNAPNSTVLNPYMMDQAKSIMEMQNQNLHEGALMNIRDQSMMNGGYGGDRQGIAEGVAIRGSDMNTRSALANLFSGAYENQAGRDLSRYQGDQSNATNRFGITTGAQTAASNLQGQQAMANAQLQAGQENNRNSFYTAQRGQDFEQQRLAAQLYGQGQQGMLSGYGQLGSIYDQNYQAPWQQLQQFANLASPLSGGSASTTSGGGPSGGQQAAMIAAQLAAAYFTGGSSLVAGSDPSMKKNIKRVGTTSDALGIYDFEYKKEYENDPFNSPGKKRGLMADEVEAKYPHAVMDRGDGKKLVNYGLMGYRAP
jgi:hypothetical protein